MKRLLLILVLLILAVGSVSCNFDGSAEDTETTVFPGVEEQMGLPFSREPDRKDLPTYAELTEIYSVNSVDDVSKRFGNPQRIELVPASGVSVKDGVVEHIFWVYDSSDGDSIGIFVMWNEDGEPEVSFRKEFPRKKWLTAEKTAVISAVLLCSATVITVTFVGHKKRKKAKANGSTPE